MATVIVIGTGGTIASAEPTEGVVVKKHGAAHLLTLIPTVPDVTVEAHDFSTSYPLGWDIDWSLLCELSLSVQQHLARTDVVGVVITHGTDALEEVAQFLSLTLESPKPVVVTGSMVNQSRVGFDGASNLWNAVRLAATSDTRIGVCVALNGVVLDAADATKAHTRALDAFTSPNRRVLGRVDQDRIAIPVSAKEGRHYRVASTNSPAVPLLWSYVAAPHSAIREVSVDSDAVVIAGTGLGHVPSAWMPAIRDMVAGGKPVLIASRCGSGSTGLGNAGAGGGGYAGAGGDLDLQEAGVLWAGDRRPLHARIELMCALSAGLSLADLGEVFS
ncbi:asparaginase [Pseudarthrobacter sp. Y6]|uniref:asparaginase n=1 Tax=Pseudarthrobacter sp. Y6 TaxID=3418422 RepID=UPI003CF7DA25